MYLCTVYRCTMSKLYKRYDIIICNYFILLFTKLLTYKYFCFSVVFRQKMQSRSKFFASSSATYLIFRLVLFPLPINWAVTVEIGRLQRKYVLARNVIVTIILPINANSTKYNQQICFIHFINMYLLYF